MYRVRVTPVSEQISSNIGARTVRSLGFAVADMKTGRDRDALARPMRELVLRLWTDDGRKAYEACREAATATRTSVDLIILPISKGGRKLVCPETATQKLQD